MKTFAMRFGITGRLLALALVLFTARTNATATTWHVDATANSPGDGSAWSRPLREVTAALARARSGDEVWLKAGVHPIAQPLRVAAGVAFVGGFAGTERNAAERRGINFARETTVRITRPGASVLVLEGVEKVRIDGLTLTGASRAPAVSLHGVGPDVRFTHVRIRGNEADAPGAAVRVLAGSELHFFNCQFADNAAIGTDGGGALFVDATSGGTWDTCIVNGNVTRGGAGGGALILGGAAKLVRFVRTDFYFNEAGRTGSAFAAQGPVELRDCIISSNFCRTPETGHAVAAQTDAARITFSGQSYVVSNLAGRERPVLVRGIDGEDRTELRDEALFAPSDSGPADLSVFTARNDVHVILHDVFMPPLTAGEPQPGRWVRQTLPDYAATAAYHCVYLPTDWQPGRKFPVLAGFPGNGPFRNRYGDRSGGMPEDNPMGFGVSGGRGYIVLGLGYLDARQNLKPTGTWWGDVPATLAYTKAAVRFVCETYGGDPHSVVLFGFSRSAIGASFIGLHDESIAPLWRAFLCYDGWESQADMARDWYRHGRSSFGYDREDFGGTGVARRFARLAGRPLFILGGRGAVEALNESHRFPVRLMPKPHRNHHTSWALRDTPERAAIRAWLATEVGLPVDP